MLFPCINICAHMLSVHQKVDNFVYTTDPLHPSSFLVQITVGAHGMGQNTVYTPQRRAVVSFRICDGLVRSATDMIAKKKRRTARTSYDVIINTVGVGRGSAC